MKSFLIVLIAFILSVPALAQDLSLRNLQKLREMELPKADRKLKRKGWKVVFESKPTADMMGKAVWAYSPTPTGEGATAWCVLYYNDTSPSRILYNAYSGSAAQKIEKKIRRRNMPPISEGSILSGVEQLEHYADYSCDHYVFRLMKYKQDGFSGIKIFEKADYEKAGEDGRL